jgi:hypothetical protein
VPRNAPCVIRGKRAHATRSRTMCKSEKVYIAYHRRRCVTTVHMSSTVPWPFHDLFLIFRIGAGAIGAGATGTSKVRAFSHMGESNLEHNRNRKHGATPSRRILMRL